MKAVQVSETGGPEVLQYKEVAEPEVGFGQALVNIQAIGVNYTDIYLRSGLNPSTLPIIPGVEAAGIVSQIGDGVTEVSTGDVVAYTGIPYSYAERVVVPAQRLVKMPDGVDAETGASVMLQGLTAHYLCKSTYSVKPGDVVLVHAAAGGVGLLLTQMAKMLGAIVVGTVSTEAKMELALQAGVDHVIKYTEEDFEAVVKDIVGDKGLPVVYDAVGLTTFNKSIACLGPRGYLVLYGQSSGPVPPVPVSQLNSKSLFLTRPMLGDYISTREELIERTDEMLSWVLSGKLQLHLYGKYSLEEAREAHRLLESRSTTGKLLLIP